MTHISVQYPLNSQWETSQNLQYGLKYRSIFSWSLLYYFHILRHLLENKSKCSILVA